MIVFVPKRGHSFKGAGLYYLHDKGQDTSNRVGWTYTHNLPTDDAQKGLNYMAMTAMQANYLKQQAGVKNTGRKATLGEVYSYALSWNPDQSPDRETMMEAGMDSLKFLKLENQQAVFVYHRETNHDHIHVIVNLVSAEDGRIAPVGNDYVKFSKWAENYERNIDKKIYCENRVKNNEKRRELAAEKQARKQQREAYANGDILEKPKTGIIKHREDKLQFASKIEMLYNQSDSGIAFQAAVKEAGLVLAKGDRRGFVLLDENEKVYSLSRQLKGQRAKDIRVRLSGIEELPDIETAKAEIQDRQYFDRDQYNAEWQDRIDKAGIENDKKLRAKERFQQAVGKEKILSKESTVSEKKAPIYDDAHLIKLDKEQEWSLWSSNKRAALEKQQAEQYQRKDHFEKIMELQKQIAANDNFLGRMSGKLKTLQEELKAQQMTLKNIDQRIAEQSASLEAEIKKNHPSYLAEKQRKTEEFKAKKRQDYKQLKDREQGYEYD